MIRIILTSLLIFCLGFDMSFAASASSSFTVGTSIVGPDTVPPSTPAPLVVSNAGHAQVNLSWQPAVDNIAVAGYVLYRDGVVVATTTATNYVDTDVLPETTYSYHVVAFDAAFNYSPDSNQVTVTTLPVPVAPPPSSGGGGNVSLVPIVVNNFGVHTGNNTATISMVTNLPVRYYFSYGPSIDNPIANLAGVNFNTVNTINVTDLNPATRYQYILRGVDMHGREVELRRGYFITTAEETVSGPVNPSYFTARANGNDVALNWSNPDKYLVKIVRSHWFFPLSESEGVVIYEGYGQSFFDGGVLSQHERQYYTIFFYNDLGQRSSGAVASASHKPMTPRPPNWYPQPVPTLPTATSTDSDSGSVATSSELIANYLDGAWRIGVVQHDTINTLDTSPPLYTHRDFTILIREEYLPNTLKTIMVTFFSDEDEGGTYILTLNKETGYYEARIPGVLAEGERQVVFSLYDYGRNVVEEVHASLQFVDMPYLEEDKNTSFSWLEFWNVWSKSLLLITFLFLLALMFLWFVLWRRREEEAEKEEEIRGDIIVE